MRKPILLAVPVIFAGAAVLRRATPEQPARRPVRNAEEKAGTPRAEKPAPARTVRETAPEPVAVPAAPKAEPDLLCAVIDADPEARAAAWERAASGKETHGLVDAALRAVAGETDALVRRWAAIFLARKGGEAFATAMERAGDRETQLLLANAAPLLPEGRDRAEGILWQWAQAADDEVRARATFVLGAFVREAALPRLRRLGESDSAVRGAAEEVAAEFAGRGTKR